MGFPKIASKKRRTLYPVLLHEEDTTKSTSYINVTVEDATDTVYKMAFEKISDSSLPGTKKFKNSVARKVAKTASTKVPPGEIAKRLSSKVPKMVMYLLYHKFGMVSSAQTVYREDVYLVVQVQILHVDTKLLMAGAKQELSSRSERDKRKLLKQDVDSSNGSNGSNGTDGGRGDYDDDEDDDSVATAVMDEWIEEQNKLRQEEEELTHSAFVALAQNGEANNAVTPAWDLWNWREVLVMILSWFLTKLMPVTITRDLEKNKLPAIIQSQICGGLKEILGKKLRKAALQADFEVLPQAEEARYFFTRLQKIRAKQKKVKKIKRSRSMDDMDSLVTTSSRSRSRRSSPVK